MPKRENQREVGATPDSVICVMSANEVEEIAGVIPVMEPVPDGEINAANFNGTASAVNGESD